MATFNPFDADQWREVVARFDDARSQFLRKLAELQAPAATPALEAERRGLRARAAPLERNMNALLATMTQARNWLRGLGDFVGFSGAPDGAAVLSGLGLGPGVPAVIIGGLGAAVLITNQIFDWLRDASAHQLQDAQIRAGWTPEQIAQTRRAAPREQPKFLGLESGAIKWVAAIAGVVVIGPFLLRELQARFGKG